jgi:hypothetical protein
MANEIPAIRRPSIRPLDEWVEDFVRGLGLRVIDPANATTREQLKEYTRSWMKNCLRRTLSDLQLGANRGMTQSLEFMFDPDHTETTKRNRKARAERRAERRKRDEQEARVRKEEQFAITSGRIN